MTSPSFTQVTFRGRNDDGSQSAATWKATQGSDWTQDTGANFRVRFRIDETASRAWTNKTWNLYYQINTGGYNPIGSGTPVIYSLSDNFTQGDDCTAQLTGGTGTFVSVNNGMCESAGATNSGSAGYLFEVEYCLQLDAGYCADNDTINLRVYDSSSAIAAYTDTPVITVNWIAPPLTVTLGTPTLAGSVPAASVLKGSVSRTMGTLTLVSSIPALSGVSAPLPARTITANTLNLAATVPAATVQASSVDRGPWVRCYMENPADLIRKLML